MTSAKQLAVLGLAAFTLIVLLLGSRAAEPPPTAAGPLVPARATAAAPTVVPQSSPVPAAAPPPSAAATVASTPTPTAIPRHQSASPPAPTQPLSEETPAEEVTPIEVVPPPASSAPFPPDGVTIVGTSAVPFRWNDSAKAYYLEVFAAGQPLYSQPVRDNHIALPLQPGTFYQWQVKAYASGTMRELLAARKFQMVAALALSFDGETGEGGGSGMDRSGDHGGRGADGANGQDVDITLRPSEGGAVEVELAAAGKRQRVVLLGGADPIAVSSCGGNGGRGGSGASGPPAMNGGNGGRGGNGGNGGTITVHAAGLEVARYLRMRVDPGLAGPGGAAGSGGLALMNARPGAAVVHGTDGSRGADGAAGSAGRVVVVP